MVGGVRKKVLHHSPFQRYPGAWPGAFLVVVGHVLVKCCVIVLSIVRNMLCHVNKHNESMPSQKMEFRSSFSRCSQGLFRASL
jgi:hypothetical protein